MKRLIKRVLRVIPYVHTLEKHARNQGMYPAGHYYSPTPDKDDVDAYVESQRATGAGLPDIQLHEEDQFEVLKGFARFYPELPFPEQQIPPYRYYHDNIWFAYTDAIYLHCFLREHTPRRIIEVGSGFSSAVMLDTVDAFYEEPPEMTFIEPFPDRLNELLNDTDAERATIIAQKVQEVPLDHFRNLQAGDLLFIDSSHVVKCGSDLHRILFEILPLLPSGVFVHFHDIFYPFEYPTQWLSEGRFWNENYFLRAFLAGNAEWSIYFFNNYLSITHPDFIKESMPLCSKIPGGSIYIRRN